MKKFASALLAGVMALSLGACSSSGSSAASGSSSASSSSASSSDESIKVAMITDSGNIDDESFNQTTYEASKEWSEDNGYGDDFKYYKPSADSTEARVQAVETAIAEGHNVIVMPGYLFAGTVVQVAPENPDVKFIAIDCGLGDLLEAAVTAAGEEYDYTPDNWNLSDYVDLSNVYCAVYQEEIAGYMAGYAAVKLGYTKLGFLGGMAVPAVMRYGYGYVQGASDAAGELSEKVDINYVYGGKFAEDPAIKAVMDTWYSNGTEVVFGCGGNVYKSAAEAAQTAGGKMIGVDVDQQAIIDDTYKTPGMTVTSAMKGLAPTVKDTLTAIKDGNWSDYAGKIDTLGMVSGDDPTANYVQLGTTQYVDGKFTEDDYKQLVKDIYDGTIKVSNDTTADEPSGDNVTVNYQGTILS